MNKTLTPSKIGDKIPVTPYKTGDNLREAQNRTQQRCFTCSYWYANSKAWRPGECMVDSWQGSPVHGDMVCDEWQKFDKSPFVFGTYTTDMKPDDFRPVQNVLFGATGGAWATPLAGKPKTRDQLIELDTYRVTLLHDIKAISRLPITTIGQTRCVDYEFLKDEMGTDVLVCTEQIFNNRHEYWQIADWPAPVFILDRDAIYFEPAYKHVRRLPRKLKKRYAGTHKSRNKIAKMISNRFLEHIEFLGEDMIFPFEFCPFCGCDASLGGGKWDIEIRRWDTRNCIRCWRTMYTLGDEESATPHILFGFKYLFGKPVPVVRQKMRETLKKIKSGNHPANKEGAKLLSPTYADYKTQRS